MVRRSSAADHLKALVQSGELDSALEFATRCNLDVEEILKARWERSDHGLSSIQNNLRQIQDKPWALRQCLVKVSPSFEAMSALLAFGLAETESHQPAMKNPRSDEVFYLHARLRLLQYRDRLDSFLGIHLGRFSAEKYKIFRSTQLHSVARSFAEDGKTGALEFLIKRHAFSLAPHLLEILDAIPETLSPHSYVQLLPGAGEPDVFLPRRAQDWAESKLLLGLKSELSKLDEVSLEDSTDYMVKLSRGMLWPGENELTSWYQQRARRIDQLSGQLENSLYLLDQGTKKGVKGLESLLKEVSDLCRVSFSNPEGDTELALETWEKLDGFEKFRVILRGVDETNVVDRVLEVALPYAGEKTQGFLVRFLREVASSNLKLAAVVIEAASKRGFQGQLFVEDSETIAAWLECIYCSNESDQWELMASVISRLRWDDQEQKIEESFPGNDRGIRRGLRNALRYRETSFPRPPVEFPPRKNPAITEELEEKLARAEGYIQAGRILSYYQVPTTIGSLVSAREDVKGTKQMLRVLLSKFSRKRSSEGEWASLWSDIHTLQEKAFNFLEKDYIQFEFFRALLKAGKFSLAKSYVKDFGSGFLHSEKLENLVLQISREYFYSANSLDSPDIDRAKECLDLIPTSMSANSELDLIVAVTEKLPYLGVNLLPAQFRQFKDPVDALKMAIDSNRGPGVPVEEILEAAKLLGFKSADQMAVVEEALAREAAAYGDVALSRELCLGLARKNHGGIWDLCVALARGPEEGVLGVGSRKELLGFALRHCDEESIGELLGAWKELDLVDDEVSSSSSPGWFVEGSEVGFAEAAAVVKEDEAGDEEDGAGRGFSAWEESNEPEVFKDDEENVDEPTERIVDHPEESSSTTYQSKTPAERSTEIIRTIFENEMIHDEDLSSIEAAFNRFSTLAGKVASKQQAIALSLLLDEWGFVFQSGKKPDDENQEEEGWNDEWEVFQASELHQLWKLAIEKLLENEEFQTALSILDKHSSGTRALVNEEEAGELLTLTEKRLNTLSATKLALLLPYEQLRASYLSLLQDALERHSMSPADPSLLVLVLRSGLLPTIAGNARFRNLFSALSKAIEELSQKSRAGLLLPADALGAASLFVVIPYFISELTKGRHYRASSSFVLQHMRVPAVFSSWNVSHFALKRFLESQQSQLRQRREAFDINRVKESSLSFLSESLIQLMNSFESVVTSALATLASDM